jgi:hypothetical protein
MIITNWLGRLFTPGNGNGNGNGHANGNGNGKPDARAMTLPARATPVGNGASLSPLVDPDDVLAFEFGRARRYERALSIVVIAPTSWPDEQGTEPPRVLPLLTAAGLREILRETDIMCYQPTDGRFVLGLTESNGPAARLALERVQALFKERLRIDLAIGVAQFPSDGLTLEDLVDAARAQVGATKGVDVVPAEAHAPPTRKAHPARGSLVPSRALGSE